MKVLHLSMLYPPMILGGAEKSVALIAEEQARAGYTVGAACIHPTGMPREIQNGVAVYRMPHSTAFWPMDWPDKPKPLRAYAKFQQQFNTKLESEFEGVLADFEPDLLHTHSLVDVSTLVWRAAHRRGIPIVHTLRDYHLMCSNASLFKGGRRCERRHLKCRAIGFMKNFHQQAVGAVAAVGRETLQTHLDAGYFSHVPENLRRVIWNPAVVAGAQAGYRKPSREGEPLSFGYLGRINVEKGVGTLLDAARRLPSEGWQLKIAGRANDSLDPFRQQAKGLPVDFMGFVDPVEFFEGIDVLIVPSIWAEPLPRTILEACAMDTPSLGARSGGIPDLIGADKDNWLFEPGDAAGLATRMHRLLQLSREELRAEVSFQAVLAETKPETVIARYEALYEALLGQPITRPARVPARKVA